MKPKTNKIRGMAKNLIMLDVDADFGAARHAPCSHPGCRSHVSHPCEVCGRQWADRKPPLSTTDINDIRDLRRRNWTMKRLATHYGVSQ